MAKRGRPAFQATPALRRKVEQYVSCGMSEDNVARALKIATETLRKHFPEELVTGRSIKRAEVIDNLFKQMRAGNVSATKKLEEMTMTTQVAEDAKDFDGQHTVAKPAKLGKKEEAALAATTAGLGTEWADDLRTPPTTGAKPN